MGVAISQLIPKKEIDISKLAGKKLAVDASNVLYQFLTSIRQMDGTPLMDNENRVTSHLMGLSTRIPKLMEQNINLCFVFDGKPPAIKMQESKRREEKKTIAKSKFKKALLEKDTKSMLKYSKQFTKLEKNIVEESKEFIEAMGLPVIQSPSEAEAQAAYMAEQKDVFGVISQDTDALLYSAPRIIRNLTASAKKKVNGMYAPNRPELIEINDVLKKLEITKDQLLALSILVGTDYNPKGVKGIGPKTAIKLVKKHKNFDELFASVETKFEWKEIYRTFREMPVIRTHDLKWKRPNNEKITKILTSHDFSENRINKLLERLNEKKEKGLDSWF